MVDFKGKTMLDRMRRAVWGVLYADDAGVVTRCHDGLAGVMALIVICQELGILAPENKTAARNVRLNCHFFQSWRIPMSMW